ncbi:EamA family transporter [Candidatus Woesearchaeota archaeon]|nr:EamA family transporter [Candidatus Woesearchaeota archaeon]
MATELWAVGLVLIGTLVGAFGPILLKRGSNSFGLSIRAQLKNYNLLAGISLYGIASIIFIPALRGGELSVLYPIVSVNYVWVSLLSMKFLNEKMNKLKWVGIFLIIVGVSLIGLASR